MTADLQMARGNIEGGFNMAVGEPEFLQKHMWFGPLMDFSSSWPYPSIDGHEMLLEELRLMYPRQHVVITNGAKQALLAAFYAYKQFDESVSVLHKAPYWPSYPTLAKLSGLEFKTVSAGSEAYADEISCITSPNNPDGHCSAMWNACDIWDAVYASEVYGSFGNPIYETAVYSAAKMLGLSGMRIGWLVTTSKELAELAANYVEFTTSGVALPSQLYVAQALQHTRKYPAETSKAIALAAHDLYTNGQLFCEYLGKKHCKTSAGRDGWHGIAGMFAWFSVEDPWRFNEALNKANIRVVSGPACGGPENFYRMSMGLTPDKTEAALKALKEYL